MVVAGTTEGVWTGTPLNNPANITHRGWKKAGVADQHALLRDALVLGKTLVGPSSLLLLTEDKTAVLLTQLEALSLVGLGEDQIRNFLAWAPLSPEAAHEPSAHWRLAFFIAAHDDGTVDITAVQVAPDRAEHHARPHPSLP